jgi:hypothetical protein
MRRCDYFSAFDLMVLWIVRPDKSCSFWYILKIYYFSGSSALQYKVFSTYAITKMSMIKMKSGISLQYNIAKLHVM